jgi:hypothetical protein
MKKKGFVASRLSVILAAALFAQSDPLNFVQTGTATHELESDDLVAAHAILPVGQEVLVTNLENGAQVTVTITERISPSSSRIIDLSTTAAATAAIFDDAAQVTIEAKLQRNEPEAPVVASAPATPAPATSPIAPTPAAPTTVITQVPAPAITPVAPAPAAPTAPAPAAPATPVPATVAEAPNVAPPPASERTPTSEITPVVPPWETGHVLWPAPQNDPWLPELAQPWISGIEREQRSPHVTGPAQTPVPAFAPPSMSAPPQPAPVQSGLSVKVLPNAPGSRDSALYRVQVGAYIVRINAQEAFERLLNAGFNPVFEVQGGLTRVQIPWVRGYDVPTVGRRLYNAGFREVWIRAER